MKKKSLFWKEHFWHGLITCCGLLVIVLTLAIGAFLVYKGSGTFTKYGHSIFEFFFSSKWAPADNSTGGGAVGAAVYIVGSLSTCGLALLIAAPFSIAAAIFMTEISPKLGKSIFRPAVELFVGIPTITTIAADALKSVPNDYRKAAYGLGATRWQVIHQIVLPAAKPGIFTGIVMGLARAFGEALAVAMVIGKMRAFPKSILSPTTNLTSAIASDMGGAMEGGEYNTALWTMALLLFLISLLFIFIIHRIVAKGGAEKDGSK